MNKKRVSLKYPKIENKTKNRKKFEFFLIKTKIIKFLVQ